MQTAAPVWRWRCAMSGAPGGPIAQSGSGMLAVRARHALLRSSAASAVGRRLIAASAAPGGDEVAGGDDRTDDTVLSGRMELGRASRPAKPALLASESSRRASGADAAPRRLFARSMSASAPRSLGPIPSPRTLGPIPAPTRVPREAPPPAEPAEPSEAPAAAEEASGANWFANGSTYEIQNADFLQKLRCAFTPWVLARPPTSQARIRLYKHLFFAATSRSSR